MAISDVLLGHFLGRLLGQAPLTAYRRETVRTTMRDGTVLIGDHYAPVRGPGRGTVLVRTPYGRGLPTSLVEGRALAAHGYHVLIQSVRGTFGSDGEFTPMAQEVSDGADTVAWLREQDWFDGRLATLGASYVGWTQWTILRDPPPELRTCVIHVAPHDFRESTYGTGAFTLGDFLGWSYQITRQEYGGALRRVTDMATTARRLRPAYEGTPLPEAAEIALRGQAPWYREWAGRTDGSDPWWEPYRAGDALARVSTPVLLVGGWQDLFLEQTMHQYETLSGRGVDVGLTVGPWTHVGTATHATRQLLGETIAWLDQHMADGPRARAAAVRVFRTGENRWHSAASWPPPTTPVSFFPHPSGALSMSAGSGATAFRYDPDDPTPAVGGRTLSGTPGVRDNRALETRADVRTFTTDPLPTAVDVVGRPVLRLSVTVDDPYADVFVRLCDVDPRGRSRNFSDLMYRLDPAVSAHTLTLTLDPCFHRLLAGHRLRLLVAGGAFPRYARPAGPDGRPRASRHVIDCAETSLTLPVATA